MKKPVLKPTIRRLLIHHAKRLFVQAGGVLGPTQIPVHRMASLAAGRPMNQRDAWRWLLDQYAPGNKDLPSIPRRKTGAPTQRGSFYDTDEWRAVRFEALRLSDGRCCLCGRSKRDHGVVLHVDHIKPRSKFPELALTLANLQVLCEDCNLGKSNRDDTDWRSGDVLPFPRVRRPSALPHTSESVE